MIGWRVQRCESASVYSCRSLRLRWANLGGSSACKDAAQTTSLSGRDLTTTDWEKTLVRDGETATLRCQRLGIALFPFQNMTFQRINPHKIFHHLWKLNKATSLFFPTWQLCSHDKSPRIRLTFILPEAQVLHGYHVEESRPSSVSHPNSEVPPAFKFYHMVTNGPVCLSLLVSRM